jgi:predicted extracellular nuclease
MPRAVSRFVVAVTAAMLVASGLSLRAPVASLAAAPADLFFSEYVEGSSFNKALEIYNGTGAAVDLGAGGYSVQIFFNGSTTAGTTINLTGTLADGDVYVVADDTASASILAAADQLSTSNFFNGDDVVILWKGGAGATVVDAFGQVGVDPGTEWGSGLTSGADNTLRRLATVCAGDTDETDVFDPAGEWDGFATDTFDGLGSHTVACSADPALSIDDVSMQEGNAGTTTFDFTVSLSAPAGSGGVTFDIATADDTATVADNDYVANSLTGQTIPAGESSYGFSVTVNGDTVVEPNETFLVNVTNATGATVGDGQGIGTIVDEDVCGLTFTPIYAIQGSGMSAAITGTVTTQGVVVADLEGPTSSGIQGFYLQDATGDGDPATSDGIFVFTGNADNGLDAGDVVRVTGYARERFNQTALNGSNSNFSAVTTIVQCGFGSVTPVDVTMPFPTSTYLERFEGMLVRFPQDLVISEYFNYDRFGELVLALPLDGESRLFTPTNVVEPGDPAIDRAAEYALRRITLDDGLGVQNPSFTRHPNGAGFALDNRFRGGDTVANTVGVLGYDFDLYRIQPTGPADYTATNERPVAPEDVGGRLTVASMNMLNYFLTIDGGPDVCGPAHDLDCRGADNATEFDRQRDKLLAALEGLDADVIGLNELENTTGVEPLADIVAGLNDALGAGTYDYIATGTIGTDAIKVGYIYKPGSVTPVGSHEILDSTVDPRFDDDRSRPALAQTFEEVGTGERFTVVVNHLKSKGSACDGDPDLGDGQGNCNVTRTLAAQALVDWLATDPTGSGDPDFLIIGDLNSYAMEDPIDAVKVGRDDLAGTDDDYTNLIADFQGLYAYSYVFDGQAGYLDHALGNPSMTAQVTGAADWHINADEPDLIDYDTSFKSAAQDAIYAPDAYRSSDHDPLLVGLDLHSLPTVEVVPGGTCSAAGGTIHLVVDGPGGAGGLTLSLVGNTNPALATGVAFGGAGGSRTMTVTTSGSGTSILTIEVTDGTDSALLSIGVVVGTNGADDLTGTFRPDLVLGRHGADTISGGDGADLLCGGNGPDTISGGDGDDTLVGQKGDDVLSGDDGDDVLRGGRGADTMTGGDGGDSFDGGLGADLVTDFDAGEGDSDS